MPPQSSMVTCPCSQDRGAWRRLASREHNILGHCISGNPLRSGEVLPNLTVSALSSAGSVCVDAFAPGSIRHAFPWPVHEVEGRKALVPNPCRPSFGRVGVRADLSE